MQVSGSNPCKEVEMKHAITLTPSLNKNITKLCGTRKYSYPPTPSQHGLTIFLLSKASYKESSDFLNSDNAHSKFFLVVSIWNVALRSLNTANLFCFVIPEVSVQFHHFTGILDFSVAVNLDFSGSVGRIKLWCCF